MKITFECADKINGKLTAVVEKADYEEKVKKTLKDYRKKANIPGFRPGNAPQALIDRQYAVPVKVEEVNRLLSDKVNEYITTEKIMMLGNPVACELDDNIDFEKDETFTFTFDIAVAPEFELALTKDDKITYYNIKVDDDLINKQIEMFASRMGKHVKATSYKSGDMLKGDLREQVDGGDKAEGITVEGAVMMPTYFKDKEAEKLFDKCKPGDVVTFNPSKVYEGNAAEIASLLKIEKDAAETMNSDFTYQITEITRYEKAEVGQELFDAVYGKDECKTEEDFRKKIAEGLEKQLKADEDYRFIIDLREYCEKKVGALKFPEELLKKMMLKNNPDKDEKFVNDNFDNSIKELTWHLIREKLVEQTKIKIEDADIKAAAIEATRAQFAQYGMNNIPDELVEQYAGEMMKKQEMINNLVDRSIDRKLTETLKDVVTLKKKSTTLDDFNKLFETK